MADIKSLVSSTNTEKLLWLSYKHLAAEGELAAVGEKVAELGSLAIDPADDHVDEDGYLRAIPLEVIKDVTESPVVEQPKAETEESGTKELDEEADEIETEHFTCDICNSKCHTKRTLQK